MTNHTNNHHDKTDKKQGLFNQWAKPQASKTDIPAGCGTYIVWGIMAIFGLFIFTLGAAAVFPPLAMYLLDNPDRFKLKLPYNAIDFQKIAYIDNQFVMYGIDYNSDSREHNLVIFNSQNGESWTKSTITASKSDVVGGITNVGSSFAYFSHQCMLIGAYSRILVANDCKNWHYQTSPQITIGESQIFNFLYSATGAAVVNNTLYVSSGRSSSLAGIFSTHDGIHWQQESLPHPAESNIYAFRNGFNGIASGNNKIIALGIWQQPQGKPWTLIYTKNLTTNKWSYEISPEYITNLTRGKDRFVAMTEGQAMVLVDGDKNWQSYSIAHHSLELSYGLGNNFVAVGGIQASKDGGLNWIESNNSNKNSIWALKVACNSSCCIGVGTKYQIIKTIDGLNWVYYEFNHKNPKPHWWKSYF